MSDKIYIIPSKIEASNFTNLYAPIHKFPVLCPVTDFLLIFMGENLLEQFGNVTDEEDRLTYTSFQKTLGAEKVDKTWLQYGFQIDIKTPQGTQAQPSNATGMNNLTAFEPDTLTNGAGGLKYFAIQLKPLEYEFAA